MSFPSGNDSLRTHRQLDDWAMRDGYGGMQMMTPKIPNKGCSLRQGSGGIGGKKKVRRVTAQSPLQQERPDFCKQRHKRGGVGRNNRGVLNVSGNGM